LPGCESQWLNKICNQDPLSSIYFQSMRWHLLLLRYLSSWKCQEQSGGGSKSSYQWNE
jgi:hypothetical protein